MKLTIIYSTNRDYPQVDWFLDSLNPQRDDEIFVIVVQPKPTADSYGWGSSISVRHVKMKPTVWAGEHRLTKEDWWAKANHLNTGICLCTSEWIAFADDRSIVMPGWLDRIRAAMDASYIVCGAYQKVQNMIVERGVAKSFVANPGRDSRLNALDPRLEYVEKYWLPNKPPYRCPGEWTYGCSIAMPLEWILQIGAFSELCDGLGGEDYIMGLQAYNNGYPIYFDPEMKIVEDRTPEHSTPTMIRRDFGVSPNDYSHKLLEALRHRKTAGHPFNIRELRDNALAGKPWPAPWGPTHHWWNNVPLGEL